jgi:hypothetical protein
MSLLIRELLAKHEMAVVPQPLYSPELETNVGSGV